MIELPKKLTLIRDQVIDHVRKNTPIPENLSDLVSWFEDEGWDEILSAWDSDHVALKLDCLASLKFDDKEMIASEGLDEPLKDDLRIDYARGLISDALRQNDGYECPSVHAVEIKKANGDSAVLGWLVEIHGQGGEVAEFQGAFTDKENFYQLLSSWGLLLDTEELNLTDEAILKLWTKPSKSARSIIVSVEWGNEQYECPMAERTWKRIAQGKQVRRVEPYLYKGKRFKSEWSFNTPEVGALLVTYGDRVVGFEGRLEDALLWNNDENLNWLKELIQYGSSDSLLDALVQRSMTHDNSPPPYDYWIVEDSFVCEPSIGGQLKGQVEAVNLKGKRLLRISQEECDALMEAVMKEEGAYPDT
jgi:hypothetical protein